MRSLVRAICVGILTLGAVSCGADVSATDFNATLVSGGEINLQDQLQNSPVALWFWAPG